MRAGALAATDSGEFVRDFSLTSAEKTALLMAWDYLKPNLMDHIRNIFAKFYDAYPNYLDYFCNNELLHSHTDEAKDFLDQLIENGMRDDLDYERLIYEVKKIHPTLTRTDMMSFDDLAKKYFYSMLAPHMSRTLRSAIERVFSGVEARFTDPSDFNDEEI